MDGSLSSFLSRFLARAATHGADGVGGYADANPTGGDLDETQHIDGRRWRVDAPHQAAAKVCQPAQSLGEQAASLARTRSAWA